uniref:Uncharacterized protein n=1 Tax=Fundulus heteroclitus TaxID=8078 RepID=A0A3Q2PP43_FUNHE
MADPKYANLPGIAFNEPDVYETGDLPEDDQAQFESVEHSFLSYLPETLAKCSCCVAWHVITTLICVVSLSPLLFSLPLLFHFFFCNSLWKPKELVRA